MSGENRITADSVNSLPPSVYTIHCDFQESRHSECHDGVCQAPPPKYEDVISGEYLNSNYSNCGYLSPGYQTIDVCHRCTCTRTNTLISERSSQDSDKSTTCSARCLTLVIFIFVSLFIWRVTLFTFQ